MADELEREQLRAMLPLLRTVTKTALVRAPELIGATVTLLDEILEVWERVEAGDESQEPRLCELCEKLSAEHEETSKICAAINAAYPAFAERAATPKDTEGTK